MLTNEISDTELWAVIPHLRGGLMAHAQASWDDVSELSDEDLARNIVFWRRLQRIARITGRKATLASLEAEWRRRNHKEG